MEIIFDILFLSVCCIVALVQAPSPISSKSLNWVFLSEGCFGWVVTSRCQDREGWGGGLSTSYNLLNVSHWEYFLINIHLYRPLLPALSVFRIWIRLTVIHYVLHSASNSSSTTTPFITNEHFCRAQINYRPACQAIKSIITQSLHLVPLQ